MTVFVGLHFVIYCKYIFNPRLEKRCFVCKNAFKTLYCVKQNQFFGIRISFFDILSVNLNEFLLATITRRIVTLIVTRLAQSLIVKATAVLEPLLVASSEFCV